MPKPEPELLYTTDVAKLLGCDVRTVHRMVADGRLVIAARGKGVRGTLVFSRPTVDALLAERTAAA